MNKRERQVIMSQLAFARKYRPKDFDEIIDQEHIATTLKNAIAQNNLTHAYLFSGPRGIGKTSMARILAKALNCKNGPTQKPCNKCTFCKEITEGRSMDVLEIDGASNRGIDEIRTLRENVKFVPTAGRFKVYIIDEVHMLTTEAFNALLKTLEEPPAHVKFIFATTEPHKVLPTILSRCQRFDFRRIATSSIVSKLKKLSHSEKINFEEEALYAIARSADGSLRDAEVVLEQINSFSCGKVRLKDVNSVLGLVSCDVIFKITEKLNLESTSENLMLLDELIKSGKEASQIVSSLIDHFRNMMLIKSGCGKLVELLKDDKAKLKQQTDKFSLADILYCLAILSNTQERIKQQGLGRLFLEMALIKLAQYDTFLPGPELLEKLNNIEEKLRKLSTVSTAGIKHTTPSVKAEDTVAKASSSEAPNDIIPEIKVQQDFIEDKKPSEAVLTQETNVQTEQAENDFDLDRLYKFWPQIIKAIKKKKISLGIYLSEGQPIKMHNNVIEVGFLKEFEFHRENLEQQENLKEIEQITSDIIGHKIRLKLISCDELPDNIDLIDLQNEEQILEAEEFSEDNSEIRDFIQSAVDIFNGRIVQTEE